MTEVKLVRLSIDSFKGIKVLVLEPDGRSGAIGGPNACGKSTVYDALVWCVTGKNAAGESDFSIKPLNENGRTNRENVTSVCAVFDVGFRQVELKRSYYEKWGKRRGSREAVYEGNLTEFFVDGVPVKKNQYDEVVKELLPRFVELTDIFRFCAKMKWQERRDLLFKAANVPGDGELLERFPALAEACVNYGGDIEKLKAATMAKRKSLVGALDSTPARMDEQKRIIRSLEEYDYGRARAERDELTAEKEFLKERASTSQSQDIFEAKMAVDTAKAKVKELELQAATERFQWERDKPLKKLGVELRQAEYAKGVAAKTLDDQTKWAIELDQKLDGLRAEYMEVSGTEYKGDTVCPCCGQALPAEQVAKARTAFMERKNKELDDIFGKANEVKEQIAEQAKRLAEAQVDYEKSVAEVDRLSKAVEQAEADDNIFPKEEEFSGLISGARAELEQAEGLYEAMSCGASNDKRKAEERIREIGKEIAELDALLAKETALNMAKERFDSLRDEMAEGKAALDEADDLLFDIEEFQRKKAQVAEELVNGMFQTVSFKLFEQAINGSLKPICEPVVGGVPYSDVNTGSKIRAGLECVELLGNVFEVRYPLFIDNAECLTGDISYDGQLIKLVAKESEGMEPTWD